jgi:hypothetical protein
MHFSFSWDMGFANNKYELFLIFFEKVENLVGVKRKGQKIFEFQSDIRTPHE